MDIKTLKEKIESLDPKVHKSLINTLTEKYNRLAAKKDQIKPQAGSASDPFAKMFKKIADELNRQYIEGTIPYIIGHHPDLYHKINDMDNKLNEVWKTGLEGKTGIEDFRKVLKRWYLLLLQGIKLYTKEQG